MQTFEEIWRTAARHRRVGRELQSLVRPIWEATQAERVDSALLYQTLERLLQFLASVEGRTDANCCAVDSFFGVASVDPGRLPDELRKIVADLTGTLHDSIYAPDIARTFESLPEQLLARLKAVQRRHAFPLSHEPEARK